MDELKISEPLVPDNLYEIRKYLNLQDFYNTLFVCKIWSVYKYREKKERIIIKLKLEKEVLKHGFRRKKELDILSIYTVNGYTIGICTHNGKKYAFTANFSESHHYNYRHILTELKPYFPSSNIWMNNLETDCEIYMILKFKWICYTIYNYPGCIDVIYIISNIPFLEIRETPEEYINTFGNNIYSDKENVYKFKVIEKFYMEEIKL